MPLPVFRWIPSCLSKLGELSDRPHTPGPAVRRRSVAAERNLPPLGKGLMSERLIADYGAAACWEPTLLVGSNIFIYVHTHTQLVSLSPSQAGSISMLNPRWTSNPPRGAAPLSPGSAAWRSAHHLLLSCGQGNYPRFCACVCVCKCRCV